MSCTVVKRGERGGGEIITDNYTKIDRGLIKQFIKKLQTSNFS